MIWFDPNRARATKLLMLVFIAIVAANGCDNAAADPAVREESMPEPPPVRPAEQLIAVVDLSDSVTPAEVTRHRELLKTFAEGLSYGDRLVVVVAHERGLKKATPTALSDMPRAKNPAHATASEERALKVSRYLAVQSVERLFASPAVPGTDLFASLHTAADYVRDAGSRPSSVLMLSDMLQCVNGGLCIERPGTVPANGWIQNQQEQGILPDLSGVCMAAVGADPSTPHGVRVRQFWQDYFQATGASFDIQRYRNSVTQPATLRCT